MQSVKFLLRALSEAGDEILLFRREGVPAAPFPNMIFVRTGVAVRVDDVSWVADSNCWECECRPAEQRDRRTAEDLCGRGWTVEQEVPY